MKKTIAILLSFVMMAAALTGCGSKEAETTAAPAQTTAAAGETTQAGENEAPAANDRVLNMMNGAPITTLDPTLNRAVQDLNIMNQIYEGLYYYNDLTGECEARVAESYTVDATGCVYTFKLRPGVKFHNGDEVKASDVVFSFNLFLNSAGAKMVVPGVVDVKAIDDATVEVTLGAADASFLGTSAQMAILSEKEVTAQGDTFGSVINTAGTGPYMITEMDPDVSWTLKAFPDYYRGEAAIKTVNYRPIADASAAALALDAGELDYLQMTSVAGFDKYQADPNFGTEALAANHITFMCINACAEGPLAIKEVRQAIAYAMDKNAMNMAAFGGLGGVATHMEHPDYNAAAPSGGIIYDYNPEKAKELLAQAGYPDGVQIPDILSFTGSQFEKCATVAQANLAAVGITCGIEWNDSSTCIARWNSQDYSITTAGWPSTGDYSTYGSRWNPEVGGFHDWKNAPQDAAKWVEMLNEASAMTDEAAREAKHQEINDLIAEEAVYIPLLNKVLPCVWDADLNVVNHPGYYQIYEWSWK